MLYTKELILRVRQREQRKLRKRKLKNAAAYRAEALLDVDQWGEKIDKERCLEWAEKYAQEAETEKYLFPIRYYTRLHEFKGTNYGFNPETGYAHSYRWYSLAKVIKGKQVLNSYGYSNQTCGHRNKLEGLFDVLGIKYVSIDAPRGLQNLDAAMAYCVSEMAEAIVRKKYARDPKWHNRTIKRFQGQIELLKGFGVKGYGQKNIKAAIEKAELDRRDALDRLKEKKRQQKAMDAITVLIDETGEMESHTGLHVHDEYFYAGTWREKDYKRTAIDKGFTTVIVHKYEKPEAMPARAELYLVQA